MVVTDIFLNLNVNFDTKVLSGNVNLTVKKINEEANEVVSIFWFRILNISSNNTENFQILDTLKLNVISVIDTDTDESLEYTLSDSLGEYGSKLTIQIPKKDSDMYVIHKQILKLVKYISFTLQL